MGNAGAGDTHVLFFMLKCEQHTVVLPHSKCFLKEGIPQGIYSKIQTNKQT